ncbi:MAG: HAD family phosphatase [Pseudomonadales bacterium]|nr:HAD family phosphatase [Pseudomonadales bacterium]MCP5182916.1 HAD family phosphatase [Pseudomonadales bacterium]
MTFKLVALDIDGTLLPPGAPHEALPDTAITAAVQKLVERGVVVVLATGRMFPGTARIAHHLGIAAPLVCQQGAVIHDTHGKTLHQYTLPDDLAHALMHYATSRTYTYAWFDSARYVVSAANPMSAFYGLVSGISVEAHPDPHLSGITPTGIDIITSRSTAAGVHRDLEQRFGNRLTLLDFPTVTAAHASQASKGQALALLAAEFGIDADEVLAIGDSVNDVSMLAWAGWGATPAHADDYARGAADEVLAGGGVSGIARFLTSLAAP